MDNVLITKVKNGYTLKSDFSYNRDVVFSGDQYVFNTLEGLYEFLKENFTIGELSH